MSSQPVLNFIEDTFQTLTGIQNQLARIKRNLTALKKREAVRKRLLFGANETSERTPVKKATVPAILRKTPTPPKLSSLPETSPTTDEVTEVFNNLYLRCDLEFPSFLEDDLYENVLREDPLLTQAQIQEQEKWEQARTEEDQNRYEQWSAQQHGNAVPWYACPLESINTCIPSSIWNPTPAVSSHLNKL